ncbi:actinin alpha 2 [Haplosporangium sp. Z 11]|nr:actinin alpha 2 [Haplosporangium sp. Z 11]
MVRQFAASQLDTQKTAFMRWINFQLAPTPSYVPMASIERDLRDGKRLIALLEIVSKEPLKPERGNMRIHQMANVSKALTFLEKRTKGDDTLGTIGNEDIVDGNLKLTLGLVWTVIYRFQIQQIANTMAEQYPSLEADDLTEVDNIAKSKKKGISEQVDAKQALLRWVRYQLEDYSDVIPPMQDFHRAWRTGLAFAALIHRHEPDFLPDFYTAVLPLTFETSDEWRRTLTLAFEIALQKMSIPRLLDPEDLVDVETPDERSVMTYVSEYYQVMSKHQMEQDPALAAEMRAQRLRAKDERLAMAGEDHQARQRRLQEEAERRMKEEKEELERIRLKRMEIEGWSIRAAERAKEEEEALMKRRQEEEERSLQRRLRREQREREKALLQQQSLEVDPTKARTVASSSISSVLSESEHDFSDSDFESMDPKEQERRQQELEEKLTEYHQGIAELSEWIRQQDRDFPQQPDTTAFLDRAKDLEPLTDILKIIEEEQAIKEHTMSHLHDVREELLEYENPDLAPEQVSDMDKKWWELETIWTALTNKVVEAKDTAEEVKWIIDCSQEIDRVNGEIQKFETQLLAFAEKRSQETPQDRSQKSVLEQQDVSLSSISFLLKTYVDFLTALMDPKVHHFDAPEHLTARNNELTTVRLPHLGVIIEKAQQNLSNDRLLRTFLDSFVLSEAWIGESVDWLANIEVPIFVSEDEWNGASTVKEYLKRDLSRELDLDYYSAELKELKGELEDEQSEVNMFRSSGFAKLDEQAKAVKRSVVETQDVTAENTTKVVQELMHGVMSNLEKVEDLLPKEAEHCAFASRVLDYLLTARSVRRQLESAYGAISQWEMRQPDAEVETLVINVEERMDHLEVSLQNDNGTPTVHDSVLSRHAGLASVVKDLRVCFLEKQQAIKGDRQMREFLECTLECQAALRDFRTKLHDDPPWTGFGLEDHMPFDDFSANIAAISQSFDKFEREEYEPYTAMGSRVKAMAATSNARQDPAIVQSKLQNVSALLEDIRALKGDRERDVNTIAECRQLVTSLSTLRSDLQTLMADFSKLEYLEPSQHGNLTELGSRANDLSSRWVVLEQESVYRHLAKDPTCSVLLKDIKDYQSSIQSTQERLQERLEGKQQWDMAWEAFSERADTLDLYLKNTEQELVDRGFATLDSLSMDEQTWKRSEDDIRETEAANVEMLSSLKDFKVSRLSELKSLADSLQQVVDRFGGVDKMDQKRAKQFEESGRLQQSLREHLQRLFSLNTQEKHQVDILRQRLHWSQQLAESNADVRVLLTACNDAVAEYTKVLESCKQSRDTSGLDHAVGDHLKQQIAHLVSVAAKQSQPQLEAAQQSYGSLVDLVKAAAKSIQDVTNLADAEGQIPEHIQQELANFKDQYRLLDLQLEYAGRLAEHAIQVASYIKSIDTLDGDLLGMATELKADNEASVQAIEKVSSIRKELDNLVEHIVSVVSCAPKPSEETQEILPSVLEKYPSDLEHILKGRLDHTAELNKTLDPLLAEYQDLLRYQDGLRTLAKELEAHGEWIRESGDAAQAANYRIKALYTLWPSHDDAGRESLPLDTVSKKTQQIELESLRSQLTQETALMNGKMAEYQSIKQRIEQELQSATSRSRHLQLELERSLESMDDKIQELEATMRHHSYQLDCLEKRAVWEHELESAQDWCQELHQNLADFTSQQAQWRLSHAERTASKLVNTAQESLHQQLQDLDSSISEFESRLKMFEDQDKAHLGQTWNALSSSLVFANRPIPDDFQARQTGLETECQVLRAKIAYGADVVKQRKALEGITAGLEELERLKSDLTSPAHLSENVTQDNNGLSSFKDLASQIRSLACKLESELGALHYPTDGSSDGSRAQSQQFNTEIRNHVQSCRSRIEATKQTLDEVIHNREVSRRRQELEAIQQKQNKAIHDKAAILEKVSGLTNWASETAEVVSDVLNQELDKSKGTLQNDHNLMSTPQTALARLGDSDLSQTTLAMSASATSMSTLTPLSPTAPSLSMLSKAIPSVPELVQLSQETLEAHSIRLDKLRQEVDEMILRKAEVQKEVATLSQADDADELQISWRTKGSDAVEDKLASEEVLRQIEDVLQQNQNRISQLDSDTGSMLSEFDTKSAFMLESLDQQSRTVALALKERICLDEELAREQEAERLRIQRALEVQQFEESREKFLSWADTLDQELRQLWDTNGYVGRTKAIPAPEDVVDKAKGAAVDLLEAGTAKFSADVVKQESVYTELKDRLDALFGGEENEADRQRYTEKVDAAWSSVTKNSRGYSAILKQIRDWSDLKIALDQFEKERLDALESRVEALRWMHWEAFQLEEDSLLEFIDMAADQARDLQERADVINGSDQSHELQPSQQAILDANRAFFVERMSTIPSRIQAAKMQIGIIHETSKEIALHAKFRADLVRIETAIAQQIDAVKARLGSLERSSCFALNSKALEVVVVAANDICMDGKYQFSVLQEVEYPALERTAFDLDMLAMEEPADLENSSSSDRTGVQESMERIRAALKKLESLIEEDCFETLLAAKFYTHSKATEDIRQWIASCRDSMAQLHSSDKTMASLSKEKHQQTKEWKMKHLETLEKKLNAFGSTVQHYDELSSDFMLLHHPQSSLLDISDPSTGEESRPVSMRIILRQTVQERTKRTREDWELLKQEFLAKTAAMDEQSSEDESGVDGADAGGDTLGALRRGSMSGAVKAKALSRFGSEILEDIARVSQKIQEMFDHGPANHSTLSLAVESDGALIRSKEGHARLEMIENDIRHVLQAKVEKFDAMLSAANEQNEQEQAHQNSSSLQDLNARDHMYHHEKMVGVAMQRGLIAEAMNRLVESCSHQRKELEETAKVQNAMDLIHETSMLCDSMMATIASADRLLQPAEGTASVSLYNLSSASSTSSLTSIKAAQPKSQNMSPSGTISRATAVSRQRRSSRMSIRRSFSLSSMSEEDVQQWESNYRSLMDKLDGFTTDIERRLDTVSTLAERLNDWRLEENYGIATEHWQKVKTTALSKKEELDRVWACRPGSEREQSSSVHPLDGQPMSTRPSVMQPTASSKNRAKAILGSPVDGTTPPPTRKKRFSTGNIMARGSLVPPSPTPSHSGTVGRSSRTSVSGRVRSGTAPGITSSTYVSQPDLTKRLATVASPSLHAMSPTYSQEAKRKPPVIRKNNSATSFSSMGHVRDSISPLPKQQQQPRTIYKPDLSNALDVEVAKVVNSSGFTMKVQKLRDGQNNHLNVGRSRSDSTSSLALSVLSDNGGQEGADGTNTSSRAAKTIRGQGRLGVHAKTSSTSDVGNMNGEAGRYVFGEIEPKVCFCRILRSRKVMVRVGGGWSELSKFMEDHASLEQRKARSRLLSASNSSISVASHFGGSTSVLSGTESRQEHLRNGSSESLSNGQISGSACGSVNGDHEVAEAKGVASTNNNGDGKIQRRRKKEMIYHVRPSDDLSLKTIKFVKSGAGEGLVAI